nr:MAG TPA: hypothetical protein [Caudoviricetes sp.]
MDYLKMYARPIPSTESSFVGKVVDAVVAIIKKIVNFIVGIGKYIKVRLTWLWNGFKALSSKVYRETTDGIKDAYRKLKRISVEHSAGYRDKDITLISMNYIAKGASNQELVNMTKALTKIDGLVSALNRMSVAFENLGYNDSSSPELIQRIDQEIRERIDQFNGTKLLGVYHTFKYDNSKEMLVYEAVPDRNELASISDEEMLNVLEKEIVLNVLENSMKISERCSAAVKQLDLAHDKLSIASARFTKATNDIGNDAIKHYRNYYTLIHGVSSVVTMNIATMAEVKKFFESFIK